MSDWVWDKISAEVSLFAQQEPCLASFFHAVVLNHQDLQSALSYQIASELDTDVVPGMLIREVCEQAMRDNPDIMAAARADIIAVYERDPACDYYAMPLLYFKGYLALQAHRISHWLWCQQRESLALYMQNRISCKFDVDIHPGAAFGAGIMIDHATGLVVGETAVIGNNVSLLHSVTLGGSGCSEGLRHPQISDGVMISAGAKVLGPVLVGANAKIAAGSVVLNDVSPYSTVAGVPAKVVGASQKNLPSEEMDQQIG